MNRNVFVLLSAFAMLGFASAGGVTFGFQEEMLNCSTSFDHNQGAKTFNQYYTECTDKVRQKYVVSKKAACAYKDGLYQLPIEATRPNKKALTSHFYKYNNTVYYPISLDDKNGGMSCMDGMEYRLYQYNCSTKKSSDLRIEIPNCGVSIVQANKGKILLLDGIYEGGAKDFYRMFDVRRMSISALEIQKFKGFTAFKDYIKSEVKRIFDTTDKKFIGADYPTKINGGLFSEYRDQRSLDSSFPHNGYDGLMAVANISTNFVGDLGYSLPLSNGTSSSRELVGQNKVIKIDFLNKKITIGTSSKKNIGSNTNSQNFGYIEGSLSYPSDFIPSDMQVCAEHIKTNAITCTSAHIKDSKYTYGVGYMIRVPIGEYYVYAQLPVENAYKAYYSKFVTCGSKAECPSHSPISILVKKDTTTTGINPRDWYK